MDASGHFSTPAAVRRGKAVVGSFRKDSETWSLQSRVSEQKIPSQEPSKHFCVARLQLTKLHIYFCGDFGTALLFLSTKCTVLQ